MLSLRILLASLILLSATFASRLAQASSDGKPATNCPNEYVDELREATQGAAQNLLGGGFRCKGNTTLEDIRRLECKSGVRNIGRTLTVTDDLDKISVRMFMQQLASNSHAQANCRLSFLSYYNSNTAEKARFNEAASKAFAAISDDLKTLTEYKAKLSSEYKQLQDRSMGDRAVGSLNAEGRADYEKKIAETDQELTKMLLGVPMGYDPDVARALADMGATGTFDARKFEAGMAAAVAKYQKASEYYDNKFTVVDKANGRGNYCLGIDYRNMAGDSGQMAKWADSLPAASPGEKLFKQNLTCRLDATYGIGRSRWNTTSAVVGFAAMVFPLTSGGAAVARSVQFAGRAGSLLGAGMKASAAVSALFAMDSLRQECFPSGAMVSGDRLKPGEKCDPKADFEKAIVEPNLLACGTGALMLGTVPLHIRNLIRGARALRAERKLAAAAGAETRALTAEARASRSATAATDASNVEEIVVTAPKRSLRERLLGSKGDRPVGPRDSWSKENKERALVAYRERGEEVLDRQARSPEARLARDTEASESFNPFEGNVETMFQSDFFRRGYREGFPRNPARAGGAQMEYWWDSHDIAGSVTQSPIGKLNKDGVRTSRTIYWPRKQANLGGRTEFPVDLTGPRAAINKVNGKEVSMEVISCNKAGKCEPFYYVRENDKWVQSRTFEGRPVKDACIACHRGPGGSFSPLAAQMRKPGALESTYGGFSYGMRAAFPH